MSFLTLKRRSIVVKFLSVFFIFIGSFRSGAQVLQCEEAFLTIGQLTPLLEKMSASETVVLKVRAILGSSPDRRKSEYPRAIQDIRRNLQNGIIIEFVKLATKASVGDTILPKEFLSFDSDTYREILLRCFKQIDTTLSKTEIGCDIEVSSNEFLKVIRDSKFDSDLHLATINRGSCLLNLQFQFKNINQTAPSCR